jgi:hypothetical protein
MTLTWTGLREDDGLEARHQREPLRTGRFEVNSRVAPR